MKINAIRNFDPVSAFNGHQLGIFESWLCRYSMSRETPLRFSD